MPDCIVLAAGRSSRMGKWKPSLLWNGSTIAGEVVSEALESGCRVIVVGGYRFPDLKTLLSDFRDVILLEAADWKEGMDVSLRVALDRIETERFFIVPVDMPFIKAHDYRRLEELSGAQAIRPSFKGVPGHPVLLERSMISALEESVPGTPIRVTLSEFSEKTVPWDHDGVIRDIDLPEDYNDSMPEG